MNDENPEQSGSDYDDQSTDAGNVEGSGDEAVSDPTPSDESSSAPEQSVELVDESTPDGTETADQGGELGNVTEAVTEPLAEEKTGLTPGTFGADRADDVYKEQRYDTEGHQGRSSRLSGEEQARREQAAQDHSDRGERIAGSGGYESDSSGSDSSES